MDVHRIIQDCIADGVGLSIPPQSNHFIGDIQELHRLILHRTDVGVSFEFEPLEDASILSTTVNNEEPYAIKTEKMRTLCHDFTFSVISGTTDMKLSTFFPGAPASISRLTPDLIVEKDDRLIVLEFTTRRTRSPITLQNAFSEKVGKYQYALQDALTMSNSEGHCYYKSITLFVIAVGKTNVITNFPFSQDTINELHYRYLLSLKMESNLIGECLLTKTTEDETVVKAQLFSWIKDIELRDHESMNCFKKANYENCTRSSNPFIVTDTISKLWTSSINSAIEKETLLKDKNFREEKLNNDFKSWFTEYNIKNKKGTSRHQKSIVNMPLFTMLECGRSSGIRDRLLMNYFHDEIDDPTYRAWKSAFINFENDMTEKENIIKEKDLEPDQLSLFVEQQLQMLTLETPNPKPSMFKYNRVSLTLNNYDWIDLARQGVEKKKFINHPLIRDKEENSKLGLDYNIDISDINELFSGKILNKLFSICSAIPAMDQFRILSLLKQAVDLHGQSELSNTFKEHSMKLLELTIMNWAKIVSDIATEITVSMKQHCKQGEFILKKLKDYDVYLLIKPTRSGSHIFFSIMVLKKDIHWYYSKGSCFRNFNESDNVLWTEFISLNTSKISNWVLCESRVISLLPYWCEFYGVEGGVFSYSDKTSDGIDPEENLIKAHKMTLLSLIISLGDKKEIEETLSLSRFMTMEAFVTYPLKPDPSKMFEKFPLIFRNRLTVWIVRSLIDYSKYIIDGNIKPFKQEVVDEFSINSNLMTVNHWKGLINPLFKEELSNPGQVINLMYLGYLKNKNEIGEKNSEGELLDKILVLESKLTPEMEQTIGVKNKEPLSNNYHEYNLDLIIHACEVFMKVNGESVKNDFHNELISILTNTHVEDEFMTLKASSNMGKEYEIYSEYSTATTNKKNKEDDYYVTLDNFESQEASKLGQHSENFQRTQFYYRTPVIEKLGTYIGDERLTVATLLPICFKEVMSNGHLRICIFRKQQHGGLREIYVLNFAERVVQWVIEQAGRLICQRFMGETMTNPSGKFQVPNSHAKDIQMLPRDNISFTTYSSADAAKWSQNHFSHKFAIMFLQLFPEEWHGFFWNTLSLWTCKRIKISDNLLNLFTHHSGLKFWNESMQGVYEGYRGEISLPWIKKGRSYVETKTGMMQGILHYTSSAFHSLMNLLLEEIVKKTIKSLKTKDITCLIRTMQSSDDSGLLLTMSLNQKKFDQDVIKNKKKMMLRIMLSIHLFKAQLGQEVSIRNSIKSTFHCSRVYEFNSKFFFGNHHYEPDIKFLFSSQMISERENLVARQEELSTLITSYISSGGSFYTGFFIQMAQLFMHYRSLGCTLTNYFSILMDGLALIPDPNLGFFLMDNPIAPGMAGYSYNSWINSFHPRMDCLHKFQLSGFYKKDVQGNIELPDNIKYNLLHPNLSINYGSRVKFTRLLNRMKIPTSWCTDIDGNPEILFRKSLNTRECILKMANKLSQPGVATSLSKSAGVAGVIASGVYILRCNVFSFIDLPTDVTAENSEYKGVRKDKVSLFKILLSNVKSSNLYKDALTENDRKALFPYELDFINLRKKFEEFKSWKINRKTYEKRRIETSVEIYQKDESSKIPLLVILKAVWFPYLDIEKRKYPKTICTSAFDVMRRHIKWLRDTFEETLVASPFDHAHHMVTWFLQQQKKPKILHLLGAPLTSRFGQSTIYNAIRLNFGKFHILSGDSQDTFASYHPIKVAYHSLVGACTYFHPQQTDILKEILKNIPNNVSFDWGKSNSRNNTLCILKSIAKEEDYHRIRDMIIHNKKGYFGSWVVRQKWNKDKKHYYGDGVWTGVIGNVKTKLVVTTRNDNPNITELSSITVLRILPSDYDEFDCSLKQWIRDNSIIVPIPKIPCIKSRRMDQILAFTNQLTYSSEGVPVVMNSDHQLYIVESWDDVSKWDIVLDPEDRVKKGNIITIRVIGPHYQAGKKGEVQNVVLSLNLYESDWQVETSKFYNDVINWDHNIMNPFVLSWIQNSKLKFGEVKKVIISKKAPEALKEMFRAVLTVLFNKETFNFSHNVAVRFNRYDQKEEAIEIAIKPDNYIDTDWLDALETLDNDLDFGDDMFEELIGKEDNEEYTQDYDEEEEFNKAISTQIGSLELDELLNIDSDLANYKESLSAIYKRVISVHKCCDEFFEQVKENYPPNTIKTILSSGEYVEGESNLIDVLRFIYPHRRFDLVLRQDILAYNEDDDFPNLGF